MLYCKETGEKSKEKVDLNKSPGTPSEVFPDEEISIYCPSGSDLFVNYISNSENKYVQKIVQVP